ncbi:hypothetical protein [Congregicoccus parvus]|uniref:hypothetical protein n=1 Tax=Congregicoccus parvus TaxID=3081749 RepID=UPI003FA5568C
MKRTWPAPLGENTIPFYRTLGFSTPAFETRRSSDRGASMRRFPSAENTRQPVARTTPWWMAAGEDSDPTPPEAA